MMRKVKIKNEKDELEEFELNDDIRAIVLMINNLIKRLSSIERKFK